MDTLLEKVKANLILEHSADELYEEYVGYIFTNEPDLREMTKYKNLAARVDSQDDDQ